jgi:hypothetical protein
MDRATRPTIGFLTANIHIGAARVLWPGVLDAAQAGNANLICYPGGRLHSSEAFEAERNVTQQCRQMYSTRTHHLGSRCCAATFRLPRRWWLTW